MRTRRLLTGLLAAAAVIAGLSPMAVHAAPAFAAPVHVAFRDTSRVHVVAVHRIDSRQYAVRVSTTALRRAVDIRVLLPYGYDGRAGRRYPVLYLFHGTSGRASDWVRMGGAEATTERLPVITVMPDAGFDGDGGGWFTNWVDRTTALGPSQWETFHIDDVIPWVDASLRTVRDRSGRAVAGLSQGGFGAMTYAARHPDLFCSVASFSGAPEITRDPDVSVGAAAVIYGTAYGLDGVEPEAMFGSRVTDAVNWEGHDPANLIDNLRATSIHLWTATGVNGPYDSQPNLGASGIELLTHGSTLHFHDHLVEADVPSDYHDYTYGTHTWPYWARDLRGYAGAMMSDFAHAHPPVSVSYTSIEHRWSQWGWSVSFARAAAQEFSTLSDAGRRGFALTGSGTATVVTPPSYPPGSLVRITERGRERTSRTGSDGRLRIVVPLGSSASTSTVTIDPDS